MSRLLHFGALIMLLGAVGPACQRAATPAKQEASGFRVLGRLENAAPGTMAVLSTISSPVLVLDSGVVDARGRFALRGHMPAADICSLRFRVPKAAPASEQTMLLIVDNGTTQQVRGNARQGAETFTVQGLADTKYFLELQAQLRKQRNLAQQFGQRITEAEEQPDSVRFLQDQYYRSRIRFRRGVKHFVRAHPASLSAAYASAHLLDYNLDLAFIDSIHTLLERTRPESSFTRYMGAKLRLDAPRPVHELGPDIVLPGLDGRTTALSALRGHPILLYFWWPVEDESYRKEAREVNQLCARFAPLGLRLYSICELDNRLAWQRIVAEDSLGQTQVLDIKGRAAEQFHLDKFPACLLIDAQGHVVGQNMRGDILAEGLTSLFE